PTHKMSNFFCSLCNVNLLDENMLQIHLGTVQHQEMLNKQQRAAASSSNQSGDQPMSVDGALMCSLCDAKCTSEAAYQMHINGAKHAKKVRDAEFQRKKEAKHPDVYCQLCDLTLQPELMQTHLNGMKHLNALKASGDPTAAALITSKKNKVAEVKAMQSMQQKGSAKTLGPMLPPGSNVNHSAALSQMPKAEIQKLLGKRHHMKCSVCDVPEFTTFSQAEHHFNSKAHRVAYQQHQQQMIKAKGKLCELCKVTVSSDELLEAHRKGYKHTLRAMNGQIPPGHEYYDKFVKHQETMRNLKAGKSASAPASSNVSS
ncbi:hypothetical protein BOX15_Mlig026513g1, partial [Macrostomum lignano]